LDDLGHHSPTSFGCSCIIGQNLHWHAATMRHNIKQFISVHNAKEDLPGNSSAVWLHGDEILASIAH